MTAAPVSRAAGTTGRRSAPVALVALVFIVATLSLYGAELAAGAFRAGDAPAAPAIGTATHTSFGTVTVEHAQTIDGLTSRDMWNGMTHGIQDLVATDAAQVAVAVVSRQRRRPERPGRSRTVPARRRGPRRARRAHRGDHPAGQPAARSRHPRDARVRRPAGRGAGIRRLPGPRRPAGHDPGRLAGRGSRAGAGTHGGRGPRVSAQHAAAGNGEPGDAISPGDRSGTGRRERSMDQRIGQAGRPHARMRLRVAVVGALAMGLAYGGGLWQHVLHEAAGRRRAGRTGRPRALAPRLQPGAAGRPRGGVARAPARDEAPAAVRGHGVDRPRRRHARGGRRRNREPGHRPGEPAPRAAVRRAPR